MAYTTTTATGPANVLAAIVNYVTSDSSTAGLDWTIEKDERNSEGFGQVILKNTGTSGASQVYIGLHLVTKGDGTYYGIVCRVLKAWSDGDDMFSSLDGTGLETGYYSSSNYGWAIIPLGDFETPILIQSNKNRIVLVITNGSNYSSAYLGAFLPYASPSEYPAPLVCLTEGQLEVSKTATKDAFLSAVGSWNFAYYDATTNIEYKASIMVPRAFQASNYHSSTAAIPYFYGCHAFLLPSGTSTGVVYPCISNIYGQTTYLGAQFGYPTGENMVLLPLPVATMKTFSTYSSLTMGPIYGILDGVYWAPNSKIGVEGIVTIDSVDYRIIAHNNISTTGYFGAVRLD